MLTRLHGGSDGRSCLRCSLHFQQNIPAAVSLITNITQESRHNATRNIRYTDRQTDRPGTPCSSCRPSECLAACIPQFNVSQAQIPFSPQWTASQPLCQYIEHQNVDKLLFLIYEILSFCLWASFSLNCFSLNWKEMTGGVDSVIVKGGTVCR